MALEPGKTGELAGFFAAIREGIGWEPDFDDFDDRLRAQKYVFLAERLGIDVRYSYNIYHYGPYSPQLADDYYSLGRLREEEPLGEYEVDRLIDLVEDRGERWLEVMATVISIWEQSQGSYRREDLERRVIRKVSDMKDCTPTFVDRVIREADEEGLI